MPTLTTAIQYSFGSPTATREEEAIKGIQTEQTFKKQVINFMKNKKLCSKGKKSLNTYYIVQLWKLTDMVMTLEKKQQQILNYQKSLRNSERGSVYSMCGGENREG